MTANFHTATLRASIVLHDIVMVSLAWMGAYWLRFNLESVPEPYISQAVNALPTLLIVQAGAFWFFGLYRGIWRFASLPDLVRIGKAVLAGAAISAIVLFALTRLEDVPRSIFPLYAILLGILVSAPRLSYRWYKDHRLALGSGSRVLIVGAGAGGEMLVRDLTRNLRTSYQPVAFVDDDKNKWGTEIHGFRVYGPVRRLPELVRRHAVDLVFIAIPSATSKQMRSIVEACEYSGVVFRTLPGTQDIASGRASIQTLREVSIDDLLGREQVSLDWTGLQRGLVGKRVLITGGGGSIGSELCRQIARLDPECVVVYDNSEFNLYSVEAELRASMPNVKVVPALGDVTDRPGLERVMIDMAPEIVYHAAAYKHVPMLEPMVRTAVRNNIVGTRIVADLAHQYGVQTFVLISTDKAVNPANIMGTSKRVAEVYCQNLDHYSETRFITVRFGNVLGSAGSVVPLFQAQIARGGPVTVTHPEMTRFFMTIPEASQLIMQAGVMGRGGEIYVLDMGEPVKIRYLAEQMIRLTGRVPGEDITIEYTGLRPGEKLYEELFHEQEELAGTEHEKILLARVRDVDWSVLLKTMEEISSAVDKYEEARIVQLLRQLVPEFRPTSVAELQNVIPLENARK